MRMKILSIILALLTLCSSLQISVFAADTSVTANAPRLTVSNIDSTTNRLSWTKVDDASSYIIYLLNEDTNKYVKYGNEIKGTACRDKNLQPNTKYTYKVRAKFSDGSMGKMSNKVSIFTYNYVGNQPNNSLFAEQGEWIYFSSGYNGLYNKNKNYTKHTLSKIKKDGSCLTEINNDYAEMINVVGEYIYYIDYDSGDMKKISIDGSSEQVLIEKEALEKDCRYVVNLNVVDNMIYYAVAYNESGRDDVRPVYQLFAMKTDGSEKKYIMDFGNAYNSYSPEYMGIYNNNICYGYKVINEVIDEIWDESDPDAEPELYSHMVDTGEYCVTVINGYDIKNTYSFEIGDEFCNEIKNGIFYCTSYYSGTEKIGQFSLNDTDNKKETSLSAMHYKYIDGGMVYTAYNSKNNLTLYIGDDKGNKVYSKKGFTDYALFDDFAVLLNNNGKLEIINYYDKMKKSA